jgi:DNA-binding transcriptional regulator YiaG
MAANVPIMLSQTITEVGPNELLARVRARRKLPVAAERRRIRVDAGVKLREIAVAVGVSDMAVVRWEQGSQPRNPHHVAAYGHLLDELRRLGEVTAD